MSTQIPTEEELQAQLNKLVSGPAYFNPAHPDHERVKNAVTQYHEIEFENQAHGRRPSPMVIDTTTPHQK